MILRRNSGAIKEKCDDLLHSRSAHCVIWLMKVQSVLFVCMALLFYYVTFELKSQISKVE